MAENQRVSPVDSLDGDEPSPSKGVIKVENRSLLSELTSSSPLPASSAPYRINKVDTEQTDMSDYQYVNSDYDEEVEETSSAARELSAPIHSQSPQISKTNTNQQAESIDKFVPPLALTDSLIADDPKTDGTKAINHSLDSSMNDEDFARLENLMNNNAPLANPFNGIFNANHGQTHTPTTMNDLKLPLGLVQSVTPRANYSQNGLGPSVASSYADDDVTPRVQESSSDQPQVHFQDKQMSQMTTGQHPAQVLAYHPVQQVQQPGAQQHSQQLVQQQGQYQQQQQPQSIQQFQAQQLQNMSPYYQGLQAPIVQHQYQNQQSQFPPQQLHNEQYMLQQHPSQPMQFVPQQYQGQQLQYVQPQYQSQQEQFMQGLPNHIPLQQPYYNLQSMPLQELHQQTTASDYSTALHSLPLPSHEQQLQQTMSSGRQLPPAQLSPRHQMVSGRQTKPLTSPTSLKSSARTEENQSDKIVGTVAPKPERPGKDFIERNINRARGVSSAKGGYANRLLQSKQQQEERKQWAPGMVIPRKKAASADNALRAPKPYDETYEEPNTILQDSVNRQPVTQNVWEQRASQLSQVKSRPTEKKRNKTVVVGHSTTDTSRSSVSSRDSITESRVKFDVNLEPAKQIIASNSQMRLIGPIPQNNGKKMRDNNYISPGANNSDNLVSSVAKYHSPEKGHLTTPTYHSQITSNDSGYQQARDSEKKVTGGQHVDLASNASYSQLYQSSLHSIGDLDSTDGVHTESRWNPTSYKAINFVPDDNELTLEEIIAIEHEKLSQSVKESNQGRVDTTHSGRDLNPYQTVPPIHHQMSEESLDSCDTSSQSYSQIHKNIKEKEEKGVSYKKYTLNDYKKLNKEVKLGGLGPSADPTVLKEKHELRQKQLQLAKQARELEAKKAKAKSREGKKEEKLAQPSGRRLAQEYSKTVPKPKVAPKAIAVTPEPSANMRSARSLTKLNDVDQAQLTYRTNHSDAPAHLTNHKALQAHLTRENKQLTNGASGSAFPQSFSSPALTQNSGDGSSLDYLQTIDLLHKRHLEEKRLLAGIRQKI